MKKTKNAISKSRLLTSGLDDVGLLMGFQMANIASAPQQHTSSKPTRWGLRAEVNNEEETCSIPLPDMNSSYIQMTRKFSEFKYQDAHNLTSREILNIHHQHVTKHEI